ncbi:MAG: hypothetical protein Q8P08_02110, partial [bacterium]|nr:hypothetical protein [bacterium]
NLKKYNVYLKLMIDGLAGRPFSAQTLPPFPRPEESHREKIIKLSRVRYSTSRSIIEEKISKWTGTVTESAKAAFPQSAPPVLYDAKCTSCGKDTKVIFPPDSSRPVYCKPCLKRIKGQREEKAAPSPVSSFSLQEAVGKEPVSFSQRQREETRPKRKEVNLEELKKTLEESLKDVQREDEKPQGSQS